MRLLIILAALIFPLGTLFAEDLTVIEQDYAAARRLAAAEKKLLFVDFYTTWCGPCKKLDRLVYTNDSVRHVLGSDFILLKYNAENDSVYHLSKKYHVISYPTGLVLDAAGNTYNRRYSFRGEDFAALSEDLLGFAAEAKKRYDRGERYFGYGPEADPTIYPDYYRAYVDRTNLKLAPGVVTQYLDGTEDILSEAFFANLVYFGEESSDEVAARVIEQRQEYVRRFGEESVNVAFFGVVGAMMERAFVAQDEEAYAAAVAYARRSLNQKWADDVLPGFQQDYLKAVGRWQEYFDSYAVKKAAGEMDAGYLNYVCGKFYRECDDPVVLRQAAAWMREVTEKTPEFSYYKTYAGLLHKAGDAEEAARVVALARTAADREGLDPAKVSKALQEIE